jgi:type II secretion system protein H
MILPTGRPMVRSVDSRRAGFTLIELILVMAMMLIVLALTGPSLTGFFRGRALDGEARRLLSLTRYAQSRASAESIPMILWINEKRRTYGVESEYSFTSQDERAVEYSLANDVNIEVESSATPSAPSSTGGGTLASRDVLRIRFAPDGFLNDLHPRFIWLRQSSAQSNPSRNQDDSVVGMAPNRSRVHYEILTNLYAVYR